MERRGRSGVAQLVAPLLALALTAACGDDGGGTGTGQPPGPGGDAAAALEGVIEDYFVPNEPAFGSLSFFAPKVSAALGIGVAPAAPSAMSATTQLASCFSVDIDGAIFDYNFSGGAYEVSGTGRPAGSVRFVLYTVDAAGNPQQGSPLGTLDITCDAVFGGVTWSETIGMTVTVGSVAVLDADLSGTASTSVVSIAGPGTITAPAGSPTATFASLGGSRTFNPTSGEFGTASGFTIGYGASPLPDEISLSCGVFGEVNGAFAMTGGIRKGPVTTIPDWEFEAFIDAPSGTMSGRVYLSSPVDNGLYACPGGTWGAPTMGEPSGCADGESTVDVSTADLNAVRDVFMSWQDMWSPLNEFLVLAYDIGELPLRQQ